MMSKRSFLDVPLSSSTPKKFRGESDNRVVFRERGTAGIVKSINVQNFMCHDHFELVFNPRINFISGRNGSGKSAILTALVVGLGADSRTTSRGTALSSFIKEGKNKATIQITLTNSGSKAFKPDLYGEELTVIRILVGKTSNFKIQAHNGKVFPAKKSEILALTHKFHIQVSNPVAILNQNTARTFLSSSNSRDKFQLFMQATLFEDIFSKKLEASNDLNLMISIIEDKKRALSKVEMDLKKDRDKLLLIEKCKQSFEKRSELENELVWSRAVESEQLLADFIKKKNSLEDELKNIREKIKNKEETERRMHQEIEIVEKQLSEEVNKANEYQKEHDKLAKNKHIKVRELEEKKRKEFGIKKKIKSKEEDNRHIKAEMNDYGRKRELHEEKILETKRKVEALEQKQQDIAAAKRTLKTDYDNANNAIEQVAGVIARKKRQVQQINIQMSQKEERLRSVQSKEDTLNQYGPWMGNLVDQIKDAYKRRKFSEMPRGPLGSYITMKDQNWAALAEYALGYGTLKTFVVNSREDEKVLQSIFNRVIPRNVSRLPITCAKFVKQPFTNIKEAEYNNVFSNLEITDPVIANIIVELTNCQKTILIEDNKTAFSLLSNSQNVPANTRIGYTPDGSKHFPNTGGSVYKTYAGHLNSKVPRFVQCDQSSLLRHLRHEIKEMKSEMMNIQNEIKLNEQELSKCQQHAREIKTQIDSLNSKQMRLRDEMEKSHIEEEGELNSLDLYQEEYDNNLREIEGLRKELEEAVSNQKEVEDSVNQLNAALEELAPKLAADHATKLAKVEEMRTNLTRFKGETGTMHDKLKENQSKADHFIKRIEDQETVVEQHIKEAEELCPREVFPEPRPLTDVESELIEVQNLIEKAKEMSAGNPLELEMKIIEKLDSYEKSKMECDLAEMIAQTLTKCLKRRTRAYKLLLAQIIESTKTSFNSTLSVRGFSGELLIDMHEKKLDILILPQKNRDAKLKDTASLSGGERSYTTVAFIMALWNGMAVPFFSMDEFDIFMDSVNRGFIIDLLLLCARDLLMEDRQFLFLTPLDCSKLIVAPDLSIHKMRDPERHSSQSQQG